MLTAINEPISVIGIYKNNHFTPKKFQWRDKIIPVTQITFITDDKNGVIKIRIYSILHNNTLYRLEFNRESEIWLLREMYQES